MTEAEQRAAVVASGRSWLRTPYHHRAHIKGVGVDCAYLLLEAFVEAGLEERIDLGTYTHDWHLHRSDEKYLSVVERYMSRIDAGEGLLSDMPDYHLDPGDVLVWRVGRTFSHGAIVTEWPYIVHAYYPARMVEEVSVLRTPMAFKPVRAYSYWRPQ